MRILYLYCHPLEESFHAAIRDAGVAALRANGHEVDLCDLYAEGFQPVLTAEMRRDYHDLSLNRKGIEGYIDRLYHAEALVVQFPTWCFGFPAMLKGFFDRIFGPGITFDLSVPGKPRPMLQHIRHVVGISTYGRDRLRAFLVGNPPRKMITRYLRWFVAPGARIRYCALYHMNVATEAQRKAFLARVTTELSSLR
ncbi:MAG: NAD(P)H-dependent oxidoreductase [Methylobacterium sp.]|jgi:NAD(P)H dehydrogenase (quinone)|nr:NAD(P)H-dependent oxidoreductase [Methylobacterium sp.]MCE2933441.1 NAD(P)H-dependent oxidoreductase [Hyphomicrobiales bacterium]MCA3644068.1 NAD(P)H-dependent oxidoreductase [Methylobacterium sp.]MCA3645711.1 NAD(P)H-dependent oxidoreductase [Methylobacterium sp.]MCA3652596.1 NAD(P)H-dependent oxidoreductase [Methylobacterium sp.]